MCKGLRTNERPNSRRMAKLNTFPKWWRWGASHGAYHMPHMAHSHSINRQNSNRGMASPNSILMVFMEIEHFSSKRRRKMDSQIENENQFRTFKIYIWLYNCYIFWKSSVRFNNWYCYTKSKISNTVTLSCRAVSELIVIYFNSIVHKCTCNWSVWLFDQPFSQPNQSYLSSCHFW